MALKDVLSCIICGTPHSGTTILKNILCQHPDITSSFECGILYANSPSEIKDIPQRPWLQNFKVSYQININDISNCSTFEDVYNFILKNSPKVDSNCNKLIDKAPLYIRKLSRLLKNREDVPIVIIKKDPRNQIKSLMKRGGYSLEKACQVYGHDNDKTLTIQETEPNIKITYLEDLIINKLKTINEILSFIGEDEDSIPETVLNEMINNQKLYEFKILTEEEILYIENNVNDKHFLNIK